MTSNIQLKRLSIFESGYGADKKLHTTLEMKAPTGEIKLDLDPEAGRRILEQVATEIVAASRAAATLLREDILIMARADTAKQIPDATEIPNEGPSNDEIPL